MNITNKVRIGSMDYKVELTEEAILLNHQECKGIIEFGEHEIRINNVLQDKQGQEQTFLHEVIHGIVAERSLDLEEADEETIVDEIAKGLHQVIRDNPEIFKTNSKKLTAEIKITDTDEFKDKIQTLKEQFKKQIEDNLERGNLCYITI